MEQIQKLVDEMLEVFSISDRNERIAKTQELRDRVLALKTVKKEVKK